MRSHHRTAPRPAERRRRAGQSLPKKGDAPAHTLEPYLEADIRATHAVQHHYSGALNRQHPVWELERRVTPVIYAIERRRVPLGLGVARELQEESRRLAKLEGELFDLVGHRFNFGSVRQLEGAARPPCDLSRAPRTPKTGELQRTAQALAALDDELPALLLEWMSEQEMASYIEGMWAHTFGDSLYGPLCTRKPPMRSA